MRLSQKKLSRDLFKLLYKDVCTSEEISDLIRKGVNARDNNVHTPLMFTQTADIAKLLIEKGADVNAKDKFGKTPLILAHTEEIVRRLIMARDDLNAIDDQGNPPFTHCINIKKIKLLAMAGADVNVTYDNGETFSDFMQKTIYKDIFNQTLKERKEQET